MLQKAVAELQTKNKKAAVFLALIIRDLKYPAESLMTSIQRVTEKLKGFKSALMEIKHQAKMLGVSPQSSDYHENVEKEASRSDQEESVANLSFDGSKPPNAELKAEENKQTAKLEDSVEVLMVASYQQAVRGVKNQDDNDITVRQLEGSSGDPQDPANGDQTHSVSFGLFGQECSPTENAAKSDEKSS